MYVIMARVYDGCDTSVVVRGGSLRLANGSVHATAQL